MKKKSKKPTLLDIARQAIAEDRYANCPDDLIGTLELCWVNGAKALGLTVIKFVEGEIFASLEEWLAQLDERAPDGHLIKPARKLGDMIECKGRQLVLIANIPGSPRCLDNRPCDLIKGNPTIYSAFVPVEEVQL